ncbi:hypothetical protein QAD02_014236, partial [Eretmocerus hayati]
MRYKAGGALLSTAASLYLPHTVSLWGVHSGRFAVSPADGAPRPSENKDSTDFVVDEAVEELRRRLREQRELAAMAAAASSTATVTTTATPRTPGRRSRDWMTHEQESSGSGDYGHHLTIGPHGGVDWVRRLGLEGGGRKSSDSEISGVGSGSTSGDEMALHRSTDCIVTKELVAASESDLLRSIPPWAPSPRNQKFRVSPERERARERNEKYQHQQQQQEMQQYQKHRESIQEHRERQSLVSERDRESIAVSDSSRATSSQEDEKTSKEDKEAKKTRVKQSLMKRARSVAIFSLKLK